MSRRRRPRWIRAVLNWDAFTWFLFALLVVGVGAVIVMLVQGRGADGDPLLQLPTLVVFR